MSVADPFDLARLVQAQERDDEQALAEIRSPSAASAMKGRFACWGGDQPNQAAGAGSLRDS